MDHRAGLSCKGVSSSKLLKIGNEAHQTIFPGNKCRYGHATLPLWIAEWTIISLTKTFLNSAEAGANGWFCCRSDTAGIIHFLVK